MTKPALPKGITRDKDGSFLVDGDVVYPRVMELMGLKGRPDKFAAETLPHVVRLEIERIVEGSELDPRPDMALVIRIDASKDKWSIAAAKEGKRPAAEARHPREIKARHAMVRGKL